jgi:hypothetical protein
MKKAQVLGVREGVLGLRGDGARFRDQALLHADDGDGPTCDTPAGPDGAQFVDLGIYASWCTNLRTN